MNDRAFAKENHIFALFRRRSKVTTLRIHPVRTDLVSTDVDMPVTLYQMLCSWLPILLLLANVKIMADSSIKKRLNCHWVCETTSKESLTCGLQYGAKFKLNKLVDQNCADNTTVNSSTLVEVWIKLVRIKDRNRSEFSFMSFAAMFFSEHVLSSQFLFRNKYGERESNFSGVTCVLRPTTNESMRGTVNGLNVLHSPLFYFMTSCIQSTAFIGYVNIEENLFFSAGFTKAEMTPEYSLQFDHWGFTAVIILSYMLLIVYSIYSPYILTLFCSTIKTVQIERLSRAIKVDEPEETRVPTEVTEQEVLDKALIDLPWVNLGLDHNSSTTAAADQDFPVSVYNENSKTSKFLSSRTYARASKGHAVRGKSSTTQASYLTIQSDPADNYAAAGASLIQGKEQMGVPWGTGHREVPIKSGYAQVIDVGGSASPVGLRSFIANEVFLNSSRLSCKYPCLKFGILIMFPLFIPMWLDVFVLMIPQSFSRIATSLPSPFLTHSLYSFITEKYSGLFVFFTYVFRVFCLCFPISPNWVPSFLCRKHLKCFIFNHYVSHLFFPNNSGSACDECKETPGCPKHCEIPVNIKHNHGKSLLEIVKKNWKDVFENLYPEYQQWLLQGAEEENSCSGKKFKIFLLLGKLVLFILCMLLILLDFIVSLPIISFSYGRVWFTVNWFENRYIQAGCLIIEFFVICSSIAGVLYFSFGCALSMKVALISVFSIGMKYPVKLFLYIAINIIVWHILWSCYSSFTNIYDDLLSKLLNACSENHANELHQYKEGDVINIPEELFVSACDKLVPITVSVKKLCMHLVFWIVFLFFVFSFIMASSTGTDIPDIKVLSVTVTFLVVIHPTIWDFLLSRGKKKERKDAVLKEKVKHHVDAYFKGKLD